MSNFIRPNFQEHSFTEVIDDTGYVATCLPTGLWDEMAVCSMIYCNSLVIDTNTVTVTDMTQLFHSENITDTFGYNDTENSGTIGYQGVGTVLRAECTEFGDDFDPGENLIRTYFFCNKT